MFLIQSTARRSSRRRARLFGHVLEHLKDFFEHLFKPSSSVRAASDMRSGHDVSSRPSSNWNDDIGGELKLNGAMVDAESENAIEVDERCMFSPQYSGRAAWRLDGQLSGIGCKPRRTLPWGILFGQVYSCRFCCRSPLILDSPAVR